jgi:thiosulfate/3-mercaptopyruvate sulfurtransferase
VDARAGSRFRGEVEPVDPKAGHIPGAINAYWQENLRGDGRFKRSEDLRSLYEGLGVRTGADVVVYCGSGVTSCHDLVALELAGLPGARLYPGSWSDWASRGDAPVATGG